MCRQINAALKRATLHVATTPIDSWSVACYFVVAANFCTLFHLISFIFTVGCRVIYNF